MDIYFIRHGQTSGNLAHRHQVEHSPLTLEGRAQVEALAPVVAALKPSHLIASSHVRAVETASIIGRVCNIIPETNLLFTEIHRPKSLYGHFHGSVRSIMYYSLWYLGVVGGDMTDGQGESYATFRARLKQAAEHLSGYPSDARIVVISHAVFITLFIAHMCNYRPLTPWRAVRTFHKLLTLRNATSIHCRHTSVTNKCDWKLVVESPPPA